MTDRVDIAALARLARLEVSQEEMAKLESELPGIIAFVDAIQKVHTSTEAKAPDVRNVLRADENPYEGGTYSESLLKAAPARKGDRVVVKQVISRKNTKS